MKKLYNDCMKWREKRPWCDMETALYWVRKQREREVTDVLMSGFELPKIITEVGREEYEVNGFTLEVCIGVDQDALQFSDDAKFESVNLEHGHPTGNSKSYLLDLGRFGRADVFTLTYGEDESYEYHRDHLKKSKGVARQDAIDGRRQEVKRITGMVRGDVYDLNIYAECSELGLYETETFSHDDSDDDIEHWIRSHLYFLLRSNQMKDAA